MSFKTRCVECGQKLEFTEDLIGESVECPQCGRQLTVSLPRDSFRANVADGIQIRPPISERASMPPPTSPTPDVDRDVSPAKPKLSAPQSSNRKGEGVRKNSPGMAVSKVHRQRRSGNWLVDFVGFRIFITPLLIKIVFAGCVVIALFAIFAAIHPAGPGELLRAISRGGGDGSGSVDPRESMRIISFLGKAARVFGVLMFLMIVRIFLEYLIVIFNINSNLENISDQE